MGNSGYSVVMSWQAVSSCVHVIIIILFIASMHHNTARIGIYILKKRYLQYNNLFNGVIYVLVMIIFHPQCYLFCPEIHGHRRSP